MVSRAAERQQDIHSALWSSGRVIFWSSLGHLIVRNRKPRTAMERIQGRSVARRNRFGVPSIGIIRHGPNRDGTCLLESRLRTVRRSALVGRPPTQVSVNLVGTRDSGARDRRQAGTDSDRPRRNGRLSAAAAPPGTSGEPTRLASPTGVSNAPACAMAPKRSGCGCSGCARGGLRPRFASADHLMSSRDRGFFRRRLAWADRSASRAK